MPTCLVLCVVVFVVISLSLVRSEVDIVFHGKGNASHGAHSDTFEVFWRESKNHTPEFDCLAWTSSRVASCKAEVSGPNERPTIVYRLPAMVKRLHPTQNISLGCFMTYDDVRGLSRLNTSDSCLNEVLARAAFAVKRYCTVDDDKRDGFRWSCSKKDAINPPNGVITLLPHHQPHAADQSAPPHSCLEEFLMNNGYWDRDTNWRLNHPFCDSVLQNTTTLVGHSTRPVLINMGDSQGRHSTLSLLRWLTGNFSGIEEPVCGDGGCNFKLRGPDTTVYNASTLFCNSCYDGFQYQLDSAVVSYIDHHCSRCEVRVGALAHGATRCGGCKADALFMSMGQLHDSSDYSIPEYCATVHRGVEATLTSVARYLSPHAIAVYMSMWREDSLKKRATYQYTSSLTRHYEREKCLRHAIALHNANRTHTHLPYLHYFDIFSMSGPRFVRDNYDGVHYSTKSPLMVSLVRQMVAIVNSRLHH
jgi:hypothetical protein